ncbi:MAG: OmpA family protein [Bacteroidota bacterium]
MKHLLLLLIISATLLACVPKNQYEALVTERNYYRNQTALADSLADQRAISTYDEVEVTDNELSQRIQEVESLRATNIALNNSYQNIKSRYDELLTQSQSMLAKNGEEVTGLQQNLADRTAAVAQREAELRQLELDLRAREESIARVESDYVPAGGVEPSAYGRVSSVNTGIPDVSGVQNAALVLNNIQSDLNQLLANNLANTDYVVAPAGINRLQVTLAERVLTDDGFTVSTSGQQILRRMAQVLRNYPGAEYIITGHSDNQNPNALRAYEDSTDKSINVAQQLVNFGLDPGKITAGGKGFYAPVGDSTTEAGRQANRRTDFYIIIPQ